MTKIIAVRSILLSAPYANPETNLEVANHLKSGYRTCGMVEITLDDGTTGLGEGYLAVFAPHIFEELINLLSSTLIGRDINDHAQINHDLQLTTGYWSLQGAAQHALSAIDIALWDCRAKLANMPLYRLLGYEGPAILKLYASGGDSLQPEAMEKEFEQIQRLGCDVFKIRARKEDVYKARWCLEHGSQTDIRIAIDMTQNLAMPSQSIDDISNFLQQVGFNDRIAFIEEALGPDAIDQFPALRSQVDIKIAGGEIVTTVREMSDRLRGGYYDIVQPDATVIGGVQSIVDIFTIAREVNCDVYVHCWGGAVGMMANYHAALGGGGTIAELPLPSFSLREAMVDWQIQDGHLYLPDTPGLGVHLTPEIEHEFAFRDDAIYACLVPQSKKLPDSVWR